MKDEIDCSNCKMLKVRTFGMGICYFYEIELYRDNTDEKHSWKRAVSCDEYDGVLLWMRKDYSPKIESQRRKRELQEEEENWKQETIKLELEEKDRREKFKKMLINIITFPIRETYKTILQIFVLVVAGYIGFQIGK